jgi:hypothetical protein
MVTATMAAAVTAMRRKARVSLRVRVMEIRYMDFTD